MKNVSSHVNQCNLSPKQIICILLDWDLIELGVYKCKSIAMRIRVTQIYAK